MKKKNVDESGNSNQFRVKLNFLRNWVDEISNISNIDDKEEIRRKKRWKEIGEEVLTRKSLFIAALKDLNKEGIKGEIQRLAATDVFVEKATKIITKRAQILIWSGAGVSLIIATLLIVFGIYIIETNIASDIIKYKVEYFQVLLNDKTINKFIDKDFNACAQDMLCKPMDINGYTLTLIMFKKVSTSAFMIGLAIFLAYVARAFFHEGFTLYSKRHSLRFGRLYVYLKDGNIDFKELEEAFQWNKEFPTAFKDIKPELLSKTMLSVFPEITKYLAEAAKSYAEILKEKNQPPKN